MTGAGRISFQITGAETDNTTTTSVAEETGNATSVNNNRAYSDRGCWKDKCGSSERARTRNGVHKEGPVCDGSR